MKPLATVISNTGWALLLALFPVTSLAHTLNAPVTVQADASGSFSYQFEFTAGPGSATVAGLGWDALQNTTAGFHGDCFCSPGCMYAEGESTIMPVSGSLVNPTQPGVVENWVAFCAEADIRVSTTILPFSSGGCFVNCPLGDADGVQAGSNRSPDLDSDGAVDLVDVGLFAQAYPPNLYSLCVDFDCDGTINLVDLATFALHLFHTGPVPGVCN